MAKYRVTGPDGGTYEVEAPNTASPDDVMRFVQSNIAKPANPQVSAFDAQIRKDMKPNALERLGRGFADVTQGVKQLGLNAGEAVGLVEPGAADLYTNEKTAEAELYERGRGSNAGMDWMRLAGNVAATLPAAAGPGGAAASLGTRVASGAVSGAGASASLFTPEGESKIEQTLLGAGFGAAAPAVITGIKRAFTSLVNRPQLVALPQLEQTLTLELQKHGVDFNRLTSDVKQSLLDDAKRALEVGGKLDSAALERKAVIESVGAKPTAASVTRDPRAWQTEKNLRGIQGVGDEIVKREQVNAQAMIDYLGKLKAQSGGRAATALEAGESAVNAIRAQDAAKKQVVDQLYDAYRGMGAQDTPVPDTRIAETLGRVLDEFGAENIPPAVLNRLKAFGFMDGQRTKLLTINEADKLNRLINNNNPGRGTPGARVLHEIKQALDESLLDIPEQGATEALKTARGAAAQRFAEQRAGKGITAAIDDVAPDRFVKRFVLDADVRDVRAMMGELKKSPQGQQAIKDVKGHLFDSLLLKATGSTSADDIAGKFSGANFSKALDSIAPEKLHQIFTPSEVEALRTLQKASKYLTSEVPFSDVNYSRTTAALANLLQKVGNTPLLGNVVSPIIGVGKIGADWVKDANARKQVAEALLGSAVTGGGKRAPIAPKPLEKFIPGAGAAALYGAGE